MVPTNRLAGVIPSRTRVRILVKFFLNPDMRAYLRELATEFNVSTNAVRVELNNLTEHHILKMERDGRTVRYQANTQHPLFPELSSMVRKITGIDELVKSVVDRLGNLEAAYLVGDYARGADSGIIDVVLVGKIDKQQLDDFVQKTEVFIERKIRSLVVSRRELDQLQSKNSLGILFKLWDSRDERGTARRSRMRRRAAGANHG
jgi:DNA-binding transcriptional ArsR family regulator